MSQPLATTQKPQPPVLKSLTRLSSGLNMSLSDCTCPICLEILYEPVNMPCHHELCMPCYKLMMVKIDFSCPMCRKPIQQNGNPNSVHNLINAKRWAQIQKMFPDEVKNRVEGKTASILAETIKEQKARGGASSSSPPHRQFCNKPGEIAKEYAEYLKSEEERQRKEKEEEERLSNELIQQILQEEQAFNNQPQNQQIQNQQNQLNQIANQLNQQMLQLQQMQPIVLAAPINPIIANQVVAAAPAAAPVQVAVINNPIAAAPLAAHIPFIPPNLPIPSPIAHQRSAPKLARSASVRGRPSMKRKSDEVAPPQPQAAAAAAVDQPTTSADDSVIIISAPLEPPRVSARIRMRAIQAAATPPPVEQPTTSLARKASTLSRRPSMAVKKTKT